MSTETGIPGLLPTKLRQLLFGDPFGEIFPPRPNPLPLSIDGRTVALRLLRDYIANLFFFCPGTAGGPPRRFQIKAENFHIEWPDLEDDLVFPSIVVIPSRATYDVMGLTYYVEEETRDVYQQNTVLMWQGEYTETIQLEIHASSMPERRSILAGLEVAMSPTEQMSGLRFRMPDYFNELVCFTMNDRELFDDPFSARHRRRAQMGIEMRFNVVALVNYLTFEPEVLTNTDVKQPDGNPVDLSGDPNARVIVP